MRLGVFTQFNADPTTPHLMGDRSCSSRAQEGVENEVAGVRGYGEDAFDEALGFRSGENIVVEEFSNFFLGFVC